MNKKPDSNHNSKFEVLNQLIASQSVLHVFPDDVKLSEFVVQALIGIPGIGGGAICLRNGSCVRDWFGVKIETIIETLNNIPEDEDHYSIKLPKKENQYIFPIQTLERSFGYVFLLVKDSVSFETFRPAINNFINMLAMVLESRWQKEQLVNHKLHLEELVKKRTIELELEISQHRKTEKELYKSEEEFRVLYNSSPDMYVSVSPNDASILLCNDTLLNKTGYLREEIIGSPIFSMYHDDCMGEVNKAFHQFVKTGTVKDKELVLKRKDGSKIDVSLNVDAVVDKEGKILYSISSWRDINERKQAEVLLKESEYNLIRAQKIASSGHWKLHMDTMEVEGSKELLKIFGIEGETLTLDDFANVVHPDDREYDLKHIQNDIENGVPWNIEHRLLLKGNSIKWVNAIGEPIIDKEGKVTSIVGIVQDITERKQAEKALQFEKESAQKYLDIAGVMFVILNDKGEITLINKKGCEILGYSYDEIINKNWFDVCIHEDIREEIVGVYNNLISGKTEPVEYYENTVINKNGELRTIAFHNTLIRDEESRIKGVLSSGEDITERKKAEEELTKHQEDLEELIKERTKELEEKNKKLDDAILVFVGRELTVRKLEERIAELEE